MQVLVLHKGWAPVLHLAVELARLGHRVTLAGNSEPTLLRRYCESLVALDIELHGAGQLDELLRSRAWDAVVGSTEELLYAALESEAVDFERVWPRLDPALIATIRDRRLVDRWVGALGARTPRLIELDGVAVARAVAEVGLPCIVRGTAGRAGSQVRLAHTAAEAQAAVVELTAESPGTPFLQEYVRGPTVLVGGLFDHGVCRQWFAAEKTDTQPRPFGPSIRCRSTHLPPAIEVTRRIFEELNFHGLGFAEYLVAPNGEIVFVEINPRPWGSVRAARAAGIDFLTLAARQIAGSDVGPERDYAAGRDAALFPQYIGALISRHEVTFRDLPHLARSLQAVPWREPALALHFIRELYWQWNRERRRRSAGSDASGATAGTSPVPKGSSPTTGR